MRWQFKHWLIVLALLSSPIVARAQAAVAISPVARQQFFSPTGTPLANGCLFTYASGTSTPQATYSDISGNFQNSNPIILDSGGFTTLYLANQSYRFALFSSGGTNCATGSQQWIQDSVSAFQVLTNLSNITFAGVTVDPAGTPGEVGFRSDLGCLRFFGSFWDCLATLTGTQTLSNKTLPAPIIQNAVGATLIQPSIAGLTLGGVAVATGNPTNFVNFTNGAAGTTLNFLTKLVTLGSGVTAVSTATTDTGGVVGIVIGGAGTSGIDLVQRTGQALCTFDGNTTADDYVQISLTVAGNCHDTGLATYPANGGQIIGRVLTTNVGAGSYLIDLFGPEIRTPAGVNVACTNVTPVTVTNNNTQQNLLSCTIPANALIQGSLLSVDLTGLESTAAGQLTIYGVIVGGGTGCGTEPAQGVANNQPWNVIARMSVITAGATGTANWSCEYFSSPSGGGAVGVIGVIGTPTIAINTTIANTLQITVQMTVANAGNSVTEQMLKAVVF